MIRNRCEQAIVRPHGHIARVQQRKAARAIGRLHHAGFKTGLANRCRLLIPRDARDRDRCTEQICLRFPKLSGAVLDLWKHRHRNIKEIADRLAPPSFVYIVEHGAGRIGRIGHMGRAASQLPDQVAIHRAKEQITAPRFFPRTVNMIQNPLHLGRRKIRINEQTRPIRDHLCMARSSQIAAKLCRATILPNNRIVDGVACGAVPNQCRFALIGNTDRSHMVCRGLGLFQRLTRRSDNRSPEVIRVMFDPSRLREVLWEFFLGARHNGHIRIK